MSKVVIISTSLRGGSNSEALAQECRRGAEEAGHQVTFLSLKGKKIGYCVGCLCCQDRGSCVIEDDAAAFAKAVEQAEIVVFATPIYYYEMSGQMKTLLDRMNCLYASDYQFRKVYMIATAAEDGDFVFEKAYNGLQGWVDCFEKAQLCGLVSGGGINEPKEAKAHADVMQKAYELGRNL